MPLGQPAARVHQFAVAITYRDHNSLNQARYLPGSQITWHPVQLMRPQHRRWRDTRQPNVGRQQHIEKPGAVQRRPAASVCRAAASLIWPMHGWLVRVKSGLPTDAIPALTADGRFWVGIFISSPSMSALYGAVT